MGMFDYVTDKLYCPLCGKKQNKWQTKAFDCYMKDLSLKDIRERLKELSKEKERYVEAELHTICVKCDKYISIAIGQCYLKIGRK